MRFRHPVDRPRLAGRARRLRDARHRHGRRAHGAGPRLGRLPDGRPLRPRHLLPGRRGRPLPARGRSLRRPARLRREPEIDRAPAREGRARPAGKDVHSYPICWRCKNPIIFRATEQWFIALDGGPALARQQALEAIAAGALVPGLGPGAHRQHDRDAPRLVHLAPAPVGRADPGVLLRGLRQAGLLRPDLVRHVADVFETESADAWFDARGEGPAARGLQLSGAAAAPSSTRRRDILDVWFDSGSSHAAVLGQRPDLPWPADVYLEGSDQHRGWFHSSLLIGVGTRGQRALPPGGHARLHGGRRGHARSRRASATTSTPRS